MRVLHTRSTLKVALLAALLLPLTVCEPVPAAAARAECDTCPCPKEASHARSRRTAPALRASRLAAKPAGARTEATANAATTSAGARTDSGLRPRHSRGYDLWPAIRDGFGLTAGFRWDQATECPMCPKPCAAVPPPPPTGHHDPFFIGAELRLPVSGRLAAFGNFDRDWTETARWNARLGVSFRPLARSWDHHR